MTLLWHQSLQVIRLPSGEQWDILDEQAALPQSKARFTRSLYTGKRPHSNPYQSPYRTTSNSSCTAGLHRIVGQSRRGNHSCR
uniref:Uncharacterized protein n=1 Tax=Anguilla anguilla TaxID=7936 RepID=A0A0E9PAS0_ANGAN